MVRPRKKRKIGCKPNCFKYGPKGVRPKEFIDFKIEEYESIRLKDLEGLTQQECADKMGIGRTTFQRIYSKARKKIAESLINNKNLLIEKENMNVSYKRRNRNRSNEKK
ncbi:MAG: DUF134 domain-containing protein [Bacillota bacterium]